MFAGIEQRSPQGTLKRSSFSNAESSVATFVKTHREQRGSNSHNSVIDADLQGQTRIEMRAEVKSP